MTNFTQFCPPTSLPSNNAYKHMERLVRAGVDVLQISKITGLDEADLRAFLLKKPKEVSFSFADAIYQATTSDRPLYKEVDPSRAEQIVFRLADETSCTVEEAATTLGIPEQEFENIMDGTPITLGTWERVAERGKKRGIKLGSLTPA